MIRRSISQYISGIACDEDTVDSIQVKKAKEGDLSMEDTMALMEKLIAVGEEKKMYGITLEGRMGNAPAQGLYHKYGFKAEGIRKNYYPDTKEDAIIMWKYFTDEKE